MCVCLSVLCTHKCTGLGGQRKEPDPLKLELKVVVSCPLWVMGIKLGSMQSSI